MPAPDQQPKPRKLSEDLILSICQYIIDGNYPSVAAHRFGIGRTTFHRWMVLGKKFPHGLYGTLRNMVHESIAVAEAEVVKQVLHVGRAVDPKCLQWWLERKYPERWGKGRGELAQVKRELSELRKLLQNAAAHAEDAGFDSATES